MQRISPKNSLPPPLADWAKTLKAHWRAHSTLHLLRQQWDRLAGMRLYSAWRNAGYSWRWLMLPFCVFAFFVLLDFLLAIFVLIQHYATRQRQADEEQKRLLTQEQQARAEAFLHSREMEAIFEAIVDNLIVFSLNGSVKLANAAGRALLASISPTLAHLRQTQPDTGASSLVFDEAGRALTRDQWPSERILGGEQLTSKSSADVVIRLLEDKEIHCSTTGSPLFGADGNIIGAVTISRDISARYQLERRSYQSLEALLAMAELMAVPAEEEEKSQVIQREDFARIAHRLVELIRVLLGCRAVGKIRLTSGDDLMWPVAIAAYPPVDEQRWKDEIARSHLADYLEPDAIAALSVGECLYRDMDEQPFLNGANDGVSPLLFAPMLIKNRLAGIITIGLQEGAVEYTSDKLAMIQGAARLASVMLERELLTRERQETHLALQAANHELAEQNRRVQAATRLKSEFLANMSHELRTPLNGIIGFAELMHDGKVGPVSEEHKEYLGDILTSSRHLLQLINDILDISKVEAGKMEFRPELVDLTKVVREVCDILRPLMVMKHIHLTTMIDAQLTNLVIDPARFKQVLYNYLSNAIKFTPEGGQVTIRLQPWEHGFFQLEVVDTGIGISPTDMGRLFGEFQQLDASINKKYQGTGLGLALTKRMVEAQGGSVGVTSTPETGSTFFAIFPLERTKDARQPPRA